MPRLARVRIKILEDEVRPTDPVMPIFVESYRRFEEAMSA